MTTNPATDSSKPLPAVGGAAILARLRAQREAKAAAASKSKGLLVLYASQLGTATEIAKTIHAEAESRGIRCKVASMNEFGFENVKADTTPVIVMVASSTGDGDCPDNAAKFYATMKRRTNENDMLTGIQFSCLGLGDSNYTRYMHVPRVLKTRFQELGATQFYESAEADEVDGIEAVVDKWLEGLWPALQKATHTPPKTSTVSANGTTAAATSHDSPASGFLPSGVPPLPTCRVTLTWQTGAEAEKVRKAEDLRPSEQELAYRDVEEGRYAPDAPFWASISGAKYLTTEHSEDRKVVHLELDITGSGMKYIPGDSIGVVPENSDELVQGVLERLGVDGDAVFTVEEKKENGTSENGGVNGKHVLGHLGWPCTLRSALKRGCDLTGAPRKSLLRLLAEHCTEDKEKNHLLLLCSRDGRDQYTKEILEGRPSLLDLLKSNPSCKPPLDALLEALPPLPPRMYSIACSPMEYPNTIHVAFTVVRYQAFGGMRDGVATSWLERLAQPAPFTDYAANATGVGARIPIFLRSGGAFKPPEDVTHPCIFIGPGTGVAPFRGFLQQRRALLASPSSPKASSGECWLFFGCRKPDQDYLYEQEFTNMLDDGTLTHLHVAFSRAQAEKRYVQHIMKEHAAALRELLVDNKGSAFVCGDGAKMAGDVHAVLIEILTGEGALTQSEAMELLGKMAQEGRYVRDIWS